MRTAIARIVAYSLADEERDYAECGPAPGQNARQGHIYEDLALVSRWLDGSDLWGRHAASPGPASRDEAEDDGLGGEGAAGRVVIRGYLGQLAWRLDSLLGVGDWPGADVVNILTTDMAEYGVTVASLTDERAGPSAPAGRGGAEAQGSGMDRAGAMSYLMATGLGEDDSDWALDQAVIGTPGPVMAGHSSVTWSRDGGFAVTGPAWRQALPGRSAPAAAVAPLSGPEADGVSRAVRAAEAAAGRSGAAGRGCAAVEAAVARYRRGEAVPDPDGAAAVLVALRLRPVRDFAWSLMDPSHNARHRRLWADLARRAPAGYRAAPASLLAFTAWQAGDGELASVALDLALGDNPRYSMARLLRQALDTGAPPALARLPMTPEEATAACHREPGGGDAAEMGAP